MQKSLFLSIALSVALITPVLASSDGGMAYGCNKVDGQYVMMHGSKCFSQKRPQNQVRRDKGVVVNR